MRQSFARRPVAIRTRGDRMPNAGTAERLGPQQPLPESELRRTFDQKPPRAFYRKDPPCGIRRTELLAVTWYTLVIWENIFEEV